MITSARRSLRALSTRLRGPRLELIYDGEYQLPLPGALHDPRRGEKVLAWLATEGLLAPGSVRHPHAASIRSLRRVHDTGYLESLRQREAFTRALGMPVDEATQDRAVAAQRAMVGGTLLAVRLALAAAKGGRPLPAMNLGGGLHHAFADRAERFCLFNDVAVAIAAERARGFTGRVLVVDLDLHDGDGVRSLFAEDATVHTYSIHNQTNDVGEAAAATVLELGTGVGDELYLETLTTTLPPLIERFRPALVVYLAGVDPAADDRLGDWRISEAGLLERDRLVVAQARAAGAALALVLAGGYGTDAWRHTARFAAWLITGRVLPTPPSDEERLLAGYRHLAAGWSRHQLTTGDDPADDDWQLTEEDVLGGLGGVTRSHRFLGYYSLHGIELALETGGMFDRLRALGFAAPTLDLDTSSPSGDTLRVFGDADKSELLLELRAARDLRTVPGMELLRVEWLLLQNPRRGFSADRPRLPGQRHPGLGVLKDVVSMFVLICDRLHLDGVFFVPSHYHLAAQSRRSLRFLAPADEARFRALRAALESLPLGEATRAVAAGRVIDRDTGAPVEWQPAPMVLPVSERLKQRLESDEYEAEVQAARGKLRFALAR